MIFRHKWLFGVLLLFFLLPMLRPQAIAYDPQSSYQTLGIRFWEDEAPPIGFYINAGNRYILETVEQPRMGSTYGEWSVMNLLRSGYTGYDYLTHIPPTYYEDYLTRINGYVVAKDGHLDRNKSTEWSRLMLSMSALGQKVDAIGEPGTYMKLTTVTEENGKQIVEWNNAMSATALRVEQQKMYVTEPVAVETLAGTYEILQPATYTIVAGNRSIEIQHASKNITVGRDKLITITQPYNFLERLATSHKFSYRQGINGPIWELIALQTGDYSLATAEQLANKGITVATGDTVNTTGQMLDYILTREITTAAGDVGGWALSGKQPDPDITGMALQALAPYYLEEARFAKTDATFSYEALQQTVERGILTLQRLQKQNGGYASWGTINAESIVQVITALTALQLDPLAPTITLPTLQKTTTFITEGAFIDGVWTNNMIDALLTFFANGSGSSPEVAGFKHVTAGYDGGGGSGTNVNAMATDQSVYGLVAYDRFQRGENSLYNMQDMINGEYQTFEATSYTIQFVLQSGQQQTQRYAPYAAVTLPNNVSVWNTKKDGSGTRYFANELLSMPEHSITLYEDPNPNAVNTAAITQLMNEIDALPAKKALTKDHQYMIATLEAAYAKLSKTEKTHVTNYAQLVERSQYVASLISAYDDELKMENLQKTLTHLSEIPQVTTDYYDAITQARVTYEQLSAKQRMAIANRTLLEELEAKLALAREVERGVVYDVKKVQQLLQELPSTAPTTMQQQQKLFMLQQAIALLPQGEQTTLQQVKKLTTLLQQIRSAQQQKLETEHLEDELNDDSFGQQAVIGQTLHITAARTTGTFRVTMPADDLRTALTANIQTVTFSDARGIQFSMSAKALQQQLAAVNDDAIVLQISPLQYNTRQFSITWSTASGEALYAPSYMTAVIPLTYFVNGQQFANFPIAAVRDELQAIAHRTTREAVTLQIRQGGTFQFIEQDVTFSDLTGYADTTDVYYLANRLVVKGTGNGLYAPREYVTRAQFAVMINRALGLRATKQSKFRDTAGKWYEDDVQALFEAGIIKGTSATTFSPGNPLTRQQAAIMMARVLAFVNYPTSSSTTGSAYKDQAAISKEATPSVYMLKNLGVMSGANNVFQPAAPLTRMQMAKILKRTLSIAELL